MAPAGICNSSRLSLPIKLTALPTCRLIEPACMGIFVLCAMICGAPGLADPWAAGGGKCVRDVAPTVDFTVFGFEGEPLS